MKRRKPISIIAFIIFLAVFLAGCGDSTDINQKLIVTTISFDEKDEEIWYYLEIANIGAGKNGEGPSEKHIVLKGHGKNLVEARDNLDMQLEKELFLSGVYALVFTESFAEEHLPEYLYRFRVDEDYRKKGLTVITKDDPEELYESAHKRNASAGFLIDGIVEVLEESGKSFKRTTMRLLENISSDYTGILVPCVGLSEEEISLIGYSVINGPAVTDFLPVEESAGTMLFKADKPKLHFVVPYKEMNLTIEVLLTKRKITPSYEDGKINYDIKMEFNAELVYGDKKTPYNFGDEVKEEVREILTGMIKEDISDAIERAQKEYKCDYLQFDDIFRIKYPVEYRDMDWQKEFINADTSVEVKVDMSTEWGLDYSVDEAK